MPKNLGLLARWALRKKQVSIEKNAKEIIAEIELEEELRRMALQKIFARPEYSTPDGLNEYDKNYCKFEGLGDLITHDMVDKLTENTFQHSENYEVDQESIANQEESGLSDEQQSS